MKIQSVRGMRDIMPEESVIREEIIAKFKLITDQSGFKRVTLPVVEPNELFLRTLGANTDIVEKELFLIDDQDKLALRPELTAGCVRAYLENGMVSWSQPVMISTIGKAFRRERPQKNRFREFTQLDIEIIGDERPSFDFLAIKTALVLFSSLGLSDLTLSINSIGCQNCRPEFRQKLVSYFQNYQNELCPDCQRRLEKNPLRILDCKEESCQKIAGKAPKPIENLCSECQNHQQKLTEYLDQAKIDYQINDQLVRGLDYYNRTVFEINQRQDIGRQSSICGGGRYDYLIEELGGKRTPAIGWAVGLDRLTSILKSDSKPTGPEYFIIGATSNHQYIDSIIKKLNRHHKFPLFIPSADSIGKQLQLASKLGAQSAIIIGDHEAETHLVTIKNLSSGEQREIKEGAVGSL